MQHVVNVGKHGWRASNTCWLVFDLEEIEPDPGKTLSDKEKASNKRILIRKRALLLHYGGKDVQKLFSCLPAEKKGGAEDYATAVTALGEIFNTGQSTELQEFEFRSLKQEPGESPGKHRMSLDLKSTNAKCHVMVDLRRSTIFPRRGNDLFSTWATLLHSTIQSA